MPERSLDTYGQECLQIARAHGFLTPSNLADTTDVLSKLMLIVTEVAEAAEAVRQGNLLEFQEELADVIIRTLHLAAGLGLNMDAAITYKMALNSQRPYMHGKLA